MIAAKKFKTKVIDSLAQKLSDYLKSDRGRQEILNPPEKKNINAVSSNSFNEEVVTRINRGINRWCEGEDVLKVIKEIENEMKSLLSDIELIFHNIEKDITGFARSIHDVSFTVFTRSALHVNLMSNAINFIYMVRVFVKNPPVREIHRRIVKEGKAEAIYYEWLSSFTFEHIRNSIEENFGTAYDKVITRIFEEEIPQKLAGFTLTISKLHNELSDSKMKKKSFTQLREIVQDIRTNIEDFNKLMTEANLV